MITGFYAGIFALGAVFLMLNVIRRRYKYEVSLGAGGEDDLERYIRVHGNFVETVPLALILMGIIEFNGASVWAIHALGVAMIASRVMHYIGMTTGNGRGFFRKFGVALTFISYVAGGILAIIGYLIATA